MKPRPQIKAPPIESYDYMDDLRPNQQTSNEADLDNNGTINNFEQISYELKAKNRRRLAWLSLVALIASGVSIMFFVPETRLNQLDGLLEIYFLALGSVVGAYVGISTWMTKR